VISSTTKTIAAAFAVATAIGATTVQAASAKVGDGVRVAGTCTDNSSSKLKVKRDNGRLKVEFEVDQNQAGVPWAVEIRNDGRLVIQATRTTHAPSGSFSLERRIAATTGVITARATRDGESCSATGQPVKKFAVQQGAAAVEDNPNRAGDDNGNHAAGDDNGNHTGADDNGHHGNDD
jgi:hypothetical protein